MKRCLVIVLAVLLVLACAACEAREETLDNEQADVFASGSDIDEYAADTEEVALPIDERLAEIEAVTAVKVTDEETYTVEVTVVEGYSLADIEEIFYQVQADIPYDESEPNSYGYTIKTYHDATLVIKNMQEEIVYEYHAAYMPGYEAFWHSHDEYYWQAITWPEEESAFYQLFYQVDAIRPDYEPSDCPIIEGKEIFNWTKDFKFSAEQLGITQGDSISKVYDTIGEPNQIMVRYSVHIYEYFYENYMFYADYDFGQIIYVNDSPNNTYLAEYIEITSPDIVGHGALR